MIIKNVIVESLVEFGHDHICLPFVDNKAIAGKYLLNIPHVTLKSRRVVLANIATYFYEFDTSNPNLDFSNVRGASGARI